MVRLIAGDVHHARPLMWWTACGRHAYPKAEPTGAIVDAETQSLLNRWILTFCETPVLIDVQLMREVLAEHDRVEAERAA